MFPTMHTIQLLRHAMAGEKVFGTTVFDGSDTEGATEINTVLGVRKGPVHDDRFDAKLFHGPVWPVRMAFFPLTSDKRRPSMK